MSALRQQNWLGQQRVDVQHMRALESSVAGDLDLLAGRMIAGEKAVVIEGFKIIIGSGLIGQLSSIIQIDTAGGSLIHYLASENGSIFSVPQDREPETLNTLNPRVKGGFVPGVVNYIGVDLIRQADDSTADLVMFLDANTDSETPKQVPLARTLDYVIVISTQDFNNIKGIAPIAKITTDSGNRITVIEDARNIMWRLANGGTSPNPRGSYAWPGGRRENDIISQSAFGVGGGDLFYGGDKEIHSLKEWMDAAMTRIWEIGGGEHWYSLAADRNVHMVKGGTSPFTNGEFFEWDGTNLHWKSLQFVFDNSIEYRNEIANQTTDSAGLTDLVDGECVYVDIDRSTLRTVALLNPLIARKGTIKGLGGSDPPGNRFVLAWRIGPKIYIRDQSYAVGDTFRNATHLSEGMVRLTLNTLPNPTRVAGVVDTTGYAVAAGMTRDNGYTNGANMGPGSLDIGFGVDDQRVNLSSDKVSSLKDGSLEFTEVTSTPSAPPSDRAKLFLRDNGLPGLLNKTQVCVMWSDGSITVLTEGP